MTSITHTGPNGGATHGAPFGVLQRKEVDNMKWLVFGFVVGYRYGYHRACRDMIEITGRSFHEAFTRARYQ